MNALMPVKRTIPPAIKASASKYLIISFLESLLRSEKAVLFRVALFNGISNSPHCFYKFRRPCRFVHLFSESCYVSHDGVVAVHVFFSFHTASNSSSDGTTLPLRSQRYQSIENSMGVSCSSFP